MSREHTCEHSSYWTTVYGNCMACENADQRQRITKLEQALRLHLAVSPDDPLLLTPVEQQIVMLTQQLAEAKCGEQLCGHDHSTQYWELRANKAENMANDAQEAVGHYMGELAASEARVARLEEALKAIADGVPPESHLTKRYVHDDEWWANRENNGKPIYCWMARAALSQDGVRGKE